MVNYDGSHSCPGAGWQKPGCHSAPTAPPATTSNVQQSHTFTQVARVERVGIKLPMLWTLATRFTTWATVPQGSEVADCQPLAMDHGTVYWPNSILLEHLGCSTFWVLAVPVLRIYNLAAKIRGFDRKKKKKKSIYTSIQRFHITCHKGLNPWNPIWKDSSIFFMLWGCWKSTLDVQPEWKLKGWKSQQYLWVSGKWELTSYSL